MRIIVAGACGFAGSTIALNLRAAVADLDVIGIDNFIRPGSELNRRRLNDAGIRILHADVRVREDLDDLPKVDWLLDASANPSVLAGSAGHGTSSRLLMQHNLTGTVNLLELARSHGAGFILLSTSRVYSIPPLAGLALEVANGAFLPAAAQPWPHGLSRAGVAEGFSTAAPISLYGASKLCAETLALEYGATFQFPVWINRLGVLAGAGQFGRADQGIFSFWIHSCAAGRSLRFIGFGGQGHQVRDCLHPIDLVPVLRMQMQSAPAAGAGITNFAGGVAASLSLRQLHAWCEERFGQISVTPSLEPRPFDVPWLVLDAACAHQRFDWTPITSLEAVLSEIADHASAHPQWLDWTHG